MSRALRLAHDSISSYATVTSQNPAYYDSMLVEMSLAALVIFWVQCQDTPEALQLLSVQVSLELHLMAVE